MRRLITFLLLFISCFGYAQVQYLGAPKTTVVNRGVFKIDSVLILPKNTTAVPVESGALKYQISDSSLYQWTGFAWRRAGGDPQALIDTAAAIRATINAINVGVTSVATSYGILGGTITSTGTLTADTSSLSTKLNTQKVVDDTAAVLRALASSSVYHSVPNLRMMHSNGSGGFTYDATYSGRFEEGYANRFDFLRTQDIIIKNFTAPTSATRNWRITRTMNNANDTVNSISLFPSDDGGNQQGVNTPLQFDRNGGIFGFNNEFGALRIGLGSSNLYQHYGPRKIQVVGSSYFSDTLINPITLGSTDSSDALANTRWVKQRLVGLGGGGGAISALTAATGTNTINNADYKQEWQWNTLANSDGALKLSSSSTAGTNGNKMLHISRSGANASSGVASYGVYTTVTNTGTTSDNLAGYFSASGGASNTGVQGLGSNYGVRGTANGASGGVAVYGFSSSPDAKGVHGNITATTGTNTGVEGSAVGSGATVNYGVKGSASGATTNYGVYGSGTTYGIYGLNNATPGATGVFGLGYATTGTNYGVRGDATGSGATTNYAGYFNASGATTNYASYAQSGITKINSLEVAYTFHTSPTLTINATHYFIAADATSNNITITLPDAAGIAGRVYIVKKTDGSANTVTIDGDGADTIDGSATVVFTTQNEYNVFVSNGANWLIIGG
jgi:hypothetical protein